MSKAKPVQTGHVVKDYYIGHTHIMVCDDCYRDKTPEQVEKDWERIEQKCYDLLYRAEIRKREQA